jgi:predicted SAM-dependent methyltransferase
VRSFLKKIYFFLKRVQFFFLGVASRVKLYYIKYDKVNLCSGDQKIPGYASLDYSNNVDITMNLASGRLPFKSDSLEVVTCISAINYFTRQRGAEIVNEVYRSLRKGGVARFASQDLEWIVKRYIEKDTEFFFQKLPNGSERFPGRTMADKINSWFYGYETIGGASQYFYDYETLEDLFINAGFSLVEKKDYMDSRLNEIELIDNRKNQMFFLEAVKK